MGTARYYHTSTLLQDGTVLVAGGTDGSVGLAGAELYDPAADRWTALPGMASVRELATATLLPSGRVLVAGG